MSQYQISLECKLTANALVVFNGFHIHFIEHFSALFKILFSMLDKIRIGVVVVGVTAFIFLILVSFLFHFFSCFVELSMFVLFSNEHVGHPQFN